MEVTLKDWEHKQFIITNQKHSKLQLTETKE